MKSLTETPPISIRLIYATKNETTARMLAGQVAANHGLEPIRVEPYHKGGHNAYFLKLCARVRWQHQVYETIILAQDIGRSWNMTGWVAEEVSLTTSDTHLRGVNFLALALSRNQQTRE